MKKVWVATYIYHPVWAGPAERFTRYGAGLKSRGVELEIITPAREGQPHIEEREGVKVTRIGSWSGKVMSLNWFMISLIRQVIKSQQRPEAVVFFSPCIGILLLMFVLRMLGINSIYVSTMARTDFRRRDSLFQQLVNLATRIAYGFFDNIVFSSTFLRDEMVQLGLKPDKLLVIPNGVSLERFRPSRNDAEKRELRARFGLPGDGLIFMFVGLCIERKGVLELLKAWKNHKETGGLGALVIVGQEIEGDERNDPVMGSAAFFEEWDQIKKTITEQDMIQFVGTKKNVDEYFRAADVFVFLSELEGTPNVIPEAMATGLSLLVNKFYGFSDELGRHDHEFLITKREVSAVKNAIERLADEKQLRDRLGSNALAWVTRTQALDFTLDKYAHLFNN